MTTRYERLNALLDILARDGKVEVLQAAAELKASPATVRRDLDHLAKQRVLMRTHGGAVANNTGFDLSIQHRATRQMAEKQRIGAAAAQMIGLGTTVGINGGVTTTEVARALAARPELSSGEGTVTLVTNAVNIAYELAARPQVKVLMTGGALLNHSYELVGPMAMESLEPLTLDMAILGVDGIDVELGARADSEAEASIDRLMAGCAREVVVVADSWKLGRRGFTRIMPISSVDVLITDSAAPDELVDRFRQANVRVLKV